MGQALFVKAGKQQLVRARSTGAAKAAALTVVRVSTEGVRGPGGSNGPQYKKREPVGIKAAVTQVKPVGEGEGQATASRQA